MTDFYCLRCAKRVELVTAREAGRIIKVSRKTIYNWINQGRVHVYKTAGGQMRLCLASLIQPIEAEPTNDQSALAPRDHRSRVAAMVKK